LGTPKHPGPLMLCILDGWGERQAKEDNAVALAATPCWDKISKEYPTTTISASGLDVGLPEGQMGNSEVGHANLGAGRLVMQTLPKINEAIERNTLGGQLAIVQLVNKLKSSGGVCHLLGLLSDGGVHSHLNHLAALANVLDKAGIEVLVHAWTDGRDTAPKSAIDMVTRFCDAAPNAKLASLCGRFYAMDRDNRWERVEQAYDLIVSGEGEKAADYRAAIEQSYANNLTNEFMPPTRLHEFQSISENDAIVCGNFRADRVREILRALVAQHFTGFERKARIHPAMVVGMVSYSNNLDEYVQTVFPSEDLRMTLGETLSKAGLEQLHIAETEKYPHVTFFFNGGREDPFPGERRIMVPSPKVTTYDLAPEMSAAGVRDALVDAINNEEFDFVIANFANPDMVGHTGDLQAAITAVETVDVCLSDVVRAILAKNGTILVTADHGNCEIMRDPETGDPHTAHTTNPVRVILVGSAVATAKLRPGGRLSDIAPTLLDLGGLDKPKEMNGRSLLEKPGDKLG
jgi:2,3-bisphosphoglycerate-independent phosphoglycerate mutase